MSNNIRISGCILAGLVLFCTGCPQYANPMVPNEIRTMTDPATDEEYLLYEPSDFDPDKEYPLVVLCHGTRPFDTADRQIRDWAGLAEEKNFIVIAPFLEGTQAATAFADPERQVDLQRQDEKRILAAVRHVRAAHNISPDKIFLTGWSAGAYAVFYTGLNNPELFRALAVVQGNFNENFLVDVADRVDPQQYIYILYGSSDVLVNRDIKTSLRWLDDHNAMYIRELTGGAHRAHPQMACRFFENLIRSENWLHIQYTEDPDNPLKIRFDILSSFVPREIVWDLGDGATSPVTSPVHTYARPGTYKIIVGAETPDGDRVTRWEEINVTN